MILSQNDKIPGENVNSTKPMILSITTLTAIILLFGILGVVSESKENISFEETTQFKFDMGRGGDNSTDVTPDNISILSSHLTPRQGNINTLFYFEMELWVPRGIIHEGAWAIIDDTAHYEMEHQNPLENTSERIFLFLNISGGDLLLEDGNHTYYPAVMAEGEMYYGKENFTIRFLVEGQGEKNEKATKDEDNWYDNSCCFIPFIVLLVLLALSLVNNLIFRYQRKRKINRERAKGGTEKPYIVPGKFDRGVCPKCRRPKMGNYNFCPGCGEEFDQHKAWQDEVSTELKKRSKTQKKKGKKATPMKKKKMGKRTFICTICNAQIKEGQEQCPNCGIDVE